MLLQSMVQQLLLLVFLFVFLSRSTLHEVSFHVEQMFHLSLQRHLTYLLQMQFSIDRTRTGEEGKRKE
jgi:hypothetical protein